MRHVISFFLLILVLAAPRMAASQESTITLKARTGVLTQPGPFRVHFNQPPPEYQQVWKYQFETGLVYGGTAEFRGWGSPVPFRVDVNHAPSLVLRHEARHFGPGFWGASRGAASTATAAAILESERACWRDVCARGLLGAGAKFYRFDANLLWDDIVDRFAPDQVRPTLHLGAGVTARLDRFSLELEVSDFSNRFQPGHLDLPGGRVHDTAITLGAGYRLR